MSQRHGENIHECWGSERIRKPCGGGACAAPSLEREPIGNGCGLSAASRAVSDFARSGSGNPRPNLPNEPIQPVE